MARTCELSELRHVRGNETVTSEAHHIMSVTRMGASEPDFSPVGWT